MTLLRNSSTVWTVVITTVRVKSSLNVAGNSLAEIIYMQQVAKPTLTQVRDHDLNSPQSV